MKLKIEQGIRLNQKQILEIGELVMSQPDMGWNYNDETKETDIVQDITLSGDHGTYHYRVNISWQMITILKVEN